MIEINFNDHIPIYIQINDQIKHMVASGQLKPGDQLPTVRQLAADLRINFNTVARAYRMLDEEGIISTQHGRGTYILEPSTKEEAQAIREDDLKALTRHYLTQAERLGFDPEKVAAIFEEKLELWKETGQPPKPEVD